MSPPLEPARHGCEAAASGPKYEEAAPPKPIPEPPPGPPGASVLPELNRDLVALAIALQTSPYPSRLGHHAGGREAVGAAAPLLVRLPRLGSARNVPFRCARSGLGRMSSELAIMVSFIPAKLLLPKPSCCIVTVVYQRNFFLSRLKSRRKTKYWGGNPDRDLMLAWRSRDSGDTHKPSASRARPERRGPREFTLAKRRPCLPDLRASRDGSPSASQRPSNGASSLSRASLLPLDPTSCPPLIPGHVSLLAELVELDHKTAVCPDGVRQRLNDPVMVRPSSRSVAPCRQSGCCQLKSGVVGNVQTPVGAQPFRLAVRHITIRHSQEILDLLSAGLVLNEPLVLQPVL